MLGTHGRLLIVLPLIAAASACQQVEKFQTASDLQNQRMDEGKQSYGAHLTMMVDNAILRDMSLADIHFIPHTDELSGVGVARLDRLAKLLNVYGGTVRYETLEQDGPFTEKRLDHAREYLALTGCNMDRVKFAVMMAGGRGMPADQAIAKYKQSTGVQKEASGGATLSPGTLMGSEGP